MLNHTMPPWKIVSQESNLGQSPYLEDSETVATAFNGTKISPLNLSFQLLLFCSSVPSGPGATSTLFRQDVTSFTLQKYKCGDECLLLR